MLRLLLGLFRRCLRSRRDLLLENLALRQQLLVLQRRKPKPRLARIDLLFWVAVRRLWPKWKQALVIVTPETVVNSLLIRFLPTTIRWRFVGIAPASGSTGIGFLQDLIFRMVVENPTWGGSAHPWRIAKTRI
jgi:hypothetical protein